MENTNMDDLQRFVAGGGMRDLGDGVIDVDNWETEEEVVSTETEKKDEMRAATWSEGELTAFDALSTDSEAKGRVEKLLKKRQRPNGLQYLVKWDGYSTDEASWMVAETLDSACEVQIQEFEDHELARQIMYAEAAESSDNSSDIDNTEEDDDAEDDTDDDAYLREKKAQEAADFKLAKILSRGEPSGNDSDDDEEESDEDELDSFFLPRTKGVPRINPSGGRKGKFPSATRLATALEGEFDVMDWATPANVAPKKKGKGKAKQLWNISDEEIEARLQDQWATDKQKKREKKWEREKMRVEGMLGSKKGKNFPAAGDKWDHALETKELLDRVRRFMMDGKAEMYVSPSG